MIRRWHYQETTAGNLVFQGGTQRNFSAYRADTGERLWNTDTQSGIVGGTATLPSPAPYTPQVFNPPPNLGDNGMYEVGEARYNEHRNSCHGANVGRVSSIFPDLRYAAALNVPELFKAIVIDGALQADGMVSFKKVLTLQDAEAIRSYIVTLANQSKNAPPAGPPGGPVATPPPALHQ